MITISEPLTPIDLLRLRENARVDPSQLERIYGKAFDQILYEMDEGTLTIGISDLPKSNRLPDNEQDAISIVAEMAKAKAKKGIRFYCAQLSGSCLSPYEMYCVVVRRSMINRNKWYPYRVKKGTLMQAFFNRYNP